MRSHLMSLIVAGVPVLFFAFAAPAEGGLPPGQEPADPEVATPSWDPLDFSGVWYNYSDRSSRTRGIGSRESMTPLTPEGIAKMDGRIPANAARVPSLANDPIYHCDPIGFPRVLLDRHESLEFIHTEDRLLQFFQWGRRLREIWLDGRELPSGENLDNLGPAWFGHSVGEWDADTLIVNTVGIDGRAWLDRQGHPISFDARVEERWRRVDADTLELRMTLFDPTYYTATWKGDYTVVFKRENPDYYNYFGWKSIYSGVTEQICAPLDEVEGFNQRIRDPGGLGIVN